MNLHDLAKEYEAYLHAVGQRPRGIARYMQHLTGFLESLPANATPDDLTVAAVRKHMRERAGTCSPGTIVGMLTAVRSFCKYLMEEDRLAIDPTTRVRWPKRQTALPRPLRSAERDALLAAIREPAGLNDDRRWYWRRNRRAIFLMLYAGLRLAETAALIWEDVDLREGMLLVREGKGGKSRLLPIHPTLKKELAKAGGGVLPAWAVAGKMSGEPLNSKAMAHIFEVWLPKRGIEGVTAHRLRHTFATELLKAGVNLAEIQELMGHTDISTTRIYIQVEVSKIKEAIEKLPGWI